MIRQERLGSHICNFVVLMNAPFLSLSLSFFPSLQMLSGGRAEARRRDAAPRLVGGRARCPRDKGGQVDVTCSLKFKNSSSSSSAAARERPGAGPGAVRGAPARPPPARCGCPLVCGGATWAEGASPSALRTGGRPLRHDCQPPGLPFCRRARGGRRLVTAAAGRTRRVKKKGASPPPPLLLFLIIIFNYYLDLIPRGPLWEWEGGEVKADTPPPPAPLL